jgi:uncharacterized OsmC-like protein
MEVGMGSETIRQALADATAYLTANPAEARYRDSPARATLRDGLLVDVTGPAGETVTTDMATSVGGTASAPSPGWLLRAAAASCVATFIAMRAATLELTLESLVVTVDSESDDRGILGIDPSIPAGPLSLHIAIGIRAPDADPERVREIARWGVEHCPVTDAVGRAVPMDMVIEV